MMGTGRSLYSCLSLVLILRLLSTNIFQVSAINKSRKLALLVECELALANVKWRQFSFS